MVHLAVRRWAHRALGIARAAVCTVARPHQRGRRLGLQARSCRRTAASPPAPCSSRGPRPAPTTATRPAAARVARSPLRTLSPARAGPRYPRASSPAPLRRAATTTLTSVGRGERHFLDDASSVVRGGPAGRLGVGHRLGRDRAGHRVAVLRGHLSGRRPARQPGDHDRRFDGVGRDHDRVHAIPRASPCWCGSRPLPRREPSPGSPTRRTRSRPTPPTLRPRCCGWTRAASSSGASTTAATDEITSTSAVDTGSWVFVAASVGAAGTALYVNGSKVASTSAVTAATELQRVVDASATRTSSSWADIPASNYFTARWPSWRSSLSTLSRPGVDPVRRQHPFDLHHRGQRPQPGQLLAAQRPGFGPLRRIGPGRHGIDGLADASGNANTGTAEGGVTLGATGPTALGDFLGRLPSTARRGYVETANSYANPEGFSLVAWFKTTSTSGGTIIGLRQRPGQRHPGRWDRLLVDRQHRQPRLGRVQRDCRRDHLPSAYNNGAWHMVVAEVGSIGNPALRGRSIRSPATPLTPPRRATRATGTSAGATRSTGPTHRRATTSPAP